MYTRTFEATVNGPVSVDLYGYESNIEVTADRDCRRAYVEVFTSADSGPSVEVIDQLSEPRGKELRVHLPKGAGSVQFNNFSSGGMVSFSNVSIGGNADMMVNGQRIQVRDGRTYVNGVEVTGEGTGSGPVTPIHFRAVVPPGSQVEAETYNGDISTFLVGVVDLTTYNGDIKAIGLTEDSRINSYNGDIRVGAQLGAHPKVKAETYNGDIFVLDNDVRVRPKTYNGDVRYPH